MKSIPFNQSHPKIILFGILVLCLNTVLPAQNLYVQPAGGEAQIAFALAEMPKITFNPNTMAIKTAAGSETFQLSEVQNLSFTQTVGIATMVTDPRISLYPNPVTEELILKLQMPTQDMSYRIFDLTGKQLKVESIHSEITQINMGNFHPGVYFFQVHQNGQNIQSFKIVKQ